MYLRFAPSITFAILGSFAGIGYPKSLWYADIAAEADTKELADLELSALKARYLMTVVASDGNAGRPFSSAHLLNAVNAGLYFFQVDCANDPAMRLSASLSSLLSSSGKKASTRI